MRRRTLLIRDRFGSGQWLPALAVFALACLWPGPAGAQSAGTALQGEDEPVLRAGELRPGIYDPHHRGAIAEPGDFSNGDRAPPARPLSTAAERRASRLEVLSPAAAATTPEAEVSSDPPNPRQTGLDGLDDETGERTAPESLPVLPIESRRHPADDNPFAAEGIRLGTFILYPVLEQGIGWTSNADSSPGGESAMLSETTLRLEGASEWSRHAVELSAFATLRKSLSGPRVSDPSAGVRGRLRLDLADGFVADAVLGYSLQRESASAAVVIPGVVSQPLRHGFDAELGLSRQTGKLRLAARGTVLRLAYDDAELIGGGTLSQKERNQTLGTLRLRAGYEISPALAPFIEAEIGRRNFDEAVDSAGYSRSADRYALRAGIEFDRGEKLRGEIAAGWISERPTDDRLAAIEGLSVGGRIEWSPLRGTVLRLDADTTVETTTEAGRSGSILHSVGVEFERQMRANLTGRLAAGFAWRDYTGSSAAERIFDVEAGLTWWLNRHAGLTGRARYETVSSNRPGRNSETVSLFLGLRLQR